MNAVSLNAIPLKSTENIDKVEIDDENECLCSYITCVVLTVIALAISIGIGDYLFYSRWYLKKDVTHVKFGARTQWNCAQTTILSTYKWEKSNK